ncbi:uncharacterized protein LOC135141130 isoform X2 [Zophobas morio]|uniref:uncharacterized protein LOC135141130 isoform X2 n=1 Tax=Zophobas morio TaxID=2755281 RepID=UPI003082865A
MDVPVETIEKACKDILKEIDIDTVSVGTFRSKIEETLNIKIPVEQKHQITEIITRVIQTTQAGAEGLESGNSAIESDSDSISKIPKIKSAKRKDASNNKSQKKSAKPNKKPKKEDVEKKPRKPGPPVLVSDSLKAVIGVDECPRTEVIKRIWQYIKENNRQDPENKKFIISDYKLKKVFDGKDRIDMLSVARHVNKHVTKKE